MVRAFDLKELIGRAVWRNGLGSVTLRSWELSGKCCFSERITEGSGIGALVWIWNGLGSLCGSCLSFVPRSVTFPL